MKTPTDGRQDLRKSEFNLFAELKRRNVFRVAAVYLATAWLIIQMGTVLGETIETPDWVMRFVILLLVLGFPGALGLAWAFEVTPQGIKRTHEVPLQESITRSTGRKLDFLIIGVLAVALALVVLDAYVLKERSQSGVGRTQGNYASIAVLPFVNLSRDADREYFSDGLSDTLIHVLAQAPELKVIARTSSFQFKGRPVDVREVGQKLGVAAVLEGSVQQSGDHLRVIAQLVNARDGVHVWSKTFDRQTADVFAIQDEIAREVLAALKVTLHADRDAAANVTAAAIPRPTSNLEAYNSYLRGEYLLRKRIGKDMEQALVEFERAVTLDPEFALAHVGLSNTHVLLADHQYRNLADVTPAAEAAIARALELDPDLAEAYAAKFLLLSSQGAPAGERLPLIERAIALNPNNAMALHWLGGDLVMFGRPSAEVLPVRERAYAIDPLAPNVIFVLAIELYGAGQQERAQALAEELAALAPENSYRLRGEFGWLDGRPDEVVRWNARATKAQPDSLNAHLGLGFAYEALGDTEAAAAHYQRIREMSPTNMQAVAWLAGLRIYTGDAPAGLSLLRDAARRYPDDPYLRRVQAWYEYFIGATQQSLATLRATEPLLFRDPPEFVHPFPYYFAPIAVFLARQTGDTARAETIATAFYAFTDSWARPAEKGFPDWMRARMAAASGDRGGVIKYLDTLYRSGAGLPAWVPSEPLFKPYVHDPEIAALITKLAERRAEWRRQLAANGL